MERNDRDGRDAAGIGPYAREREQLSALSTLGSWKVSDGEPDIRGWEVRTVSGRELGKVADLLIDTRAGEVVLLDVDLSETDRHTFVPIRVAQIDRVKRTVFMDSADLPELNVARDGQATTAGRRASDTGIVTYPRSDREVVIERPALADGAPDVSDVETERRHGGRRRIDRLSTDL